MKDKKTFFLFLMAFIVIGLLLMSEMNFHAVATDSGFDVSYDSGGSSGGDGSGLFDLIFLFINYPIPTLIFFMILMVIVSIENNKKRKADGNNVTKILNSYQDKEEKELLLKGYQIFYDIQMAWKNFDYDALKKLVTDELYNTYQNQIKTLELKGQKNIMRDFTLLSAKLLLNKEEDDQQTIIMAIEVSFYDYLIDVNTKKVLRGKDTSKVYMNYHLTFVSNKKSSGICPNCGAPLEKPNYCDYCKSHIQGLNTEMRMSKKETIKQSRKER